MEWLIAFRLVMGLGLGAEIVIGYSTLAEFIPPLLRGRWIALLAVITNSAVAVSALAGYLIIPRFGWRVTFVLAGAGALLVWHARKNMPESPRWLEAVGRLEDAELTMGRIEAEVGTALPEPKGLGRQLAVARPVSLAILFSAHVIRRTLLGILTAVIANVALYGFLSWLPTFLVLQRVGVTDSLRYTMWMSFGAPFGPLVAAFLADRIGRRVSLTITSILCAGFGAAYAMASSVPAATVAGFFLFLLMYLMATLGLVSYIPELFPTNYRLRGAGFCIAVGRLSAMLVPYAVVWAYVRGGETLILEGLGGLLVFQAVVIAAFGIRTERRTLEELAPESGGKLSDTHAR